MQRQQRARVLGLILFGTVLIVVAAVWGGVVCRTTSLCETGGCCKPKPTAKDDCFENLKHTRDVGVQPKYEGCPWVAALKG